MEKKKKKQIRRRGMPRPSVLPLRTKARWMMELDRRKRMLLDFKRCVTRQSESNSSQIKSLLDETQQLLDRIEQQKNGLQQMSRKEFQNSKSTIRRLMNRLDKFIDEEVTPC